MMFAAGFSWFHLVEPLGHDDLMAPLGITAHTTAFAHACLACLLLIGLAVLARLGLERARARDGLSRHFASDRFSALTLFEFVVVGVRSVMGDLFDRQDVKVFLPFIASIFLYLFTCNMMGIFPGFLPPTDITAGTAGLAIIVFFTFIIVGLWRDWVGFLKHMVGPVWFAMPLLFVVEMISFLFRPATLTLRITGNMFGDHTVFTVMSDLLAPLLPVPFLGLAVFVSFMQAFIFALLTAVYISMAVPHEGEEH